MQRISGQKWRIEEANTMLGKNQVARAETHGAYSTFIKVLLGGSIS
jgi:hypothetical protein